MSDQSFILLCLAMKGEGVEGCSRLDFEISEEKMWTFHDVLSNDAS